MKEVFITADFAQEGLDILKKHMKVRTGGWGFTGKKLSPEELIDAAGNCDFLVVCYEEVNEKVLKGLPNLKAVGCCRGGVRASVDVDAATALNIPVLFTPGRNAAAVADITFGLLLAEARKISLTSSLIRNQEWDKVTWDIFGDTPFKRFKGPELRGKTMGIVGFGNVGRQIYNRAKGFDMNICTHDPFCKKDRLPPDVEWLELDDLMRTADFIVMACSLSKDTEGMIGAHQIALMKETAYFVNAARGGLVDEIALYDALKEKRIAGAGIDALIEEPMKPSHPFLELDNITITPHIGGASDDITVNHSLMMAGDIERMVSGKEPKYIFNPEVLS